MPSRAALALIFVTARFRLVYFRLTAHGWYEVPAERTGAGTSAADEGACVTGPAPRAARHNGYGSDKDRE